MAKAPSPWIGEGLISNGYTMKNAVSQLTEKQIVADDANEARILPNLLLNIRGHSRQLAMTHSSGR